MHVVSSNGGVDDGQQSGGNNAISQQQKILQERLRGARSIRRQELARIAELQFGEYRLNTRVGEQIKRVISN